ncbi:energy transducer TonB [Crenobacter cavernae]|uniref:TonB family protein n=1 Tax=Crenobacter cavernae TaxID=2290923 RepID=A0ABY0FHZ6_9NEIS|nr:energy transducer TonB [Crenobacter cavernae]RXZ44571.1 TonB family protein [Crenobacter cavernae]
MSLPLHRTPSPLSQTVFAGAVVVSALVHLALLLVTNLPWLRVPMPPAADALSVTLLAPPAQQPESAQVARPVETPAVKHDTPREAPRHKAPAPERLAEPARPTRNPAPPPGEGGETKSPPPRAHRPALPSPAEGPSSPALSGDRYGLLAQARLLARGVGGAAEASEETPQAGGRVKAVYGVSAKGVDWARYIEDWRLKVERVGYLNYPEEARRQQLTGGPLLTVLINADGSLRSVRVRRGSGQPVLDEAARNIVKLAAPFAPFPPALAERFGSLEITRRWTFTTDNRLSGQ